MNYIEVLQKSLYTLSEWQKVLGDFVVTTSDQVTRGFYRRQVVIAARISDVRPYTTRKGRKMAFLHLEDLSGSLRAVVFPRIFDETHKELFVDNIIIVAGKIDYNESNESDEHPFILIDKIEPFEKSTGEFWAPSLNYYSCFVSYSTTDKDFANRLYNDLRKEGVLCWFAPENMEIGDPILDRIENSIWEYERLLIILSQHSINSTWVEREIHIALAKENERNPHVLFPVRIDNAVMELKKGWPALVRNTRHIGDFSNWKDSKDYKNSFARLLRDLTKKDASK